MEAARTGGHVYGQADDGARIDKVGEGAERRGPRTRRRAKRQGMPVVPVVPVVPVSPRGLSVGGPVGGRECFCGRQSIRYAGALSAAVQQ